MALMLDSDTIKHGIQLALAPVFLLTAVAAMIAAVSGRLARIIDRARKIEERAKSSSDPQVRSEVHIELALLRRRGRIANGCIALLTLCGLMIGITIILLFLSETTSFHSEKWAVAGFLSGVVCFIAALLCFLAETVLATRLLNFSMLDNAPHTP
jgi:Protein of unknown function (DUF2721)